jgi:hypothetical protein
LLPEGHHQGGTAAHAAQSNLVRVRVPPPAPFEIIVAEREFPASQPHAHMGKAFRLHRYPSARLTVQAVAAPSAYGAVAQALAHHRVDYAASMIDGGTVQETDGDRAQQGD